MKDDVAVKPGSLAALGAIVAGALLLQIANTIVNMVVPLRMAMAQQEPLFIGLVTSANPIGFLLGCFAVPSLLRRIGHIRAFAVFAALQSVLTLSFALIPLEGWTLARLLMGFASAGHAICIESWISGQASSSHRGRFFGFYQVLNRGALVGSQIGVGYVSLQTENVFLIASAAFSIALIPVGLTRAHAPETPEAVSVDLRELWRQAPAAVVGCLYTGLAGGPATHLTPAYGILIGLNQMSAIMLATAVQIGALLMQWPLGHAADRIDSRIVMLCGTGLVVLVAPTLAAFLHFGTAHGGPLLFGAFALIGGSGLSLYTVAVTHAFHRMGRERAVGLSAKLLFLWATGAAIGPLMATALMQILGPQGLLAYLTLLSAGIAAFLATRLSRKPAQAERIAPAPRPALPDISPRSP